MSTRYLDYTGLSTYTTYVKSYVSDADDAVLTSAKSYADTVAASAETDANTYTDTAISELSIGDYAKTSAVTTMIEGYGYATTSYVDTAESDAVSTAEGYTDTEIASLKSELESSISSAVASVYTVKGSCAFASLPSSSSTGDVWNVTDAFTTTASFVEGAGASYPAGTNVVWNGSAWDVLAGTYDLSGYLTSDDLDGYVTETALSSTLSSYVTETDLVAITADEVAALFA